MSIDAIGGPLGSLGPLGSVGSDGCAAPGKPGELEGREEAVETLHYALNGLLSAVRAGRATAPAPEPAPEAPQRHRVLAALADELDLDTIALARVVGLDPPGVQAVLDALGREGLVEASRPGRGRVSGGSPVVARLTPAGLRALDGLDAGFRRAWESALEDLSADDLRTAARVISRLSGVIIPSR